MKASVVTSAILHCSLLAFMLVTLGAPEPMSTGSIEAIPVDIVSDSVPQGDEKAPAKEKPAPKPTERPAEANAGENLGENKFDVKAAPVPNAKPSNSTATAPPKPSENQTAENDPNPNDVKDIAKEDADVVEPKEVAAIPQPKPDLTPTPPKVEEKPQDQAEPPKPDAEALPDKVPTPVVKPQPKPPEPKVAEKPVEKPQDKPKLADSPTDKKKADQKQQAAKSSNSPKSDFNADDIAALLNKDAPSAGGTKRSTQVASLGAKKPMGGTLTPSEMAGVKEQIEGNWNMPGGLTGVEQVRVSVTVTFDEAANVVGQPKITATGGPEATRRAVESACFRAIMRTSPFKNMPASKYDGEGGWNTMTFNFDPSDFAL